VNINSNFLNLQDSYLFRRIAQQVNSFKAENPGADIIRLGIGDVTRPLAPIVVQAMSDAARELGSSATFRGYDDGGVGYDFLREAIVKYYSGKNVTLSTDEIIVSDGAKSDLGNILDIFASGSTALVPDPVYPAYVDVNIMNGSRVEYVGGNADNGFLPLPSDIKRGTNPDVIYICSPNNPTGAVYDKAGLAEWVAYANESGAVILFDCAYEAFVSDNSLPTSIFEIDGARTCAIEIGTFSKLAGFTGVRCGWTVVPQELERGDSSLLKLWRRRQTTKFNGVSYITQRGAEAALSPAGLTQCRENINYYRENAKIIGSALTGLGIRFFGGIHSPYVWFEVPGGDSWAYFDYLLKEKYIVGTPGAGFGANGEGFMRLTAFGTRENTLKAAERLSK